MTPEEIIAADSLRAKQEGDVARVMALGAMREAEEFLGLILPKDGALYPWEEHGLRVRRALQKAIRLAERAK